MPRSAAAIARFDREKTEQRQKVRETLELRKSGHSFRQIAEIQGCTIRTATLRHKKALAKFVPKELVEEVRALELDRYDQLTVMNLTLLTRAYDRGDVESFCKLQDRINAVHDRRKKMVPIEVPVTLIIDQKVEHTTDQDRELADLLGKATQDVEDKIRWLTENAS